MYDENLPLGLKYESYECPYCNKTSMEQVIEEKRWVGDNNADTFVYLDVFHRCKECREEEYMGNDCSISLKNYRKAEEEYKKRKRARKWLDMFHNSK